MLRNADWTWVRLWALRIAGTALLLTAFLYYTVTPAIPGTMVARLPIALMWGLVVAVPAGLVAALVLAWQSSRTRG